MIIKKIGRTDGNYTDWANDSFSEWKSIAPVKLGYLAIKSDDSLWAFGQNQTGELGTGDSDDRYSFTLIDNGSWKSVKSVIMPGGIMTSCIGVKNNGTIWLWGDDSTGFLGVSSVDNLVLTPTQLGSETDWSVANISSGPVMLGLKQNNTLWVWGNGDIVIDGNTITAPKLGLGTETNTSTPIQIPGSWKIAKGGLRHCVGIKMDGTLWGWGANDKGQLGNDLYDYTDTPEQIGVDSDWADIFVGDDTTFAIKNNGTMYAWGDNRFRQLGGSIVTPLPTTVTPEYWWRADYGINRFTWESYSGDVDFTLFNVTNADTINGVDLNGSNSRGQSGSLPTAVDAKHIFIRYDRTNSFPGPFLGGTINSNHAVFWETGSTTVSVVDMTSGFSYTATTNISEVTRANMKAFWIDFESNPAAPEYYIDDEDTPTLMTIASGTYSNKFTWNQNTQIVLGRRATTIGQHLDANIKEVAIFTSSLTEEQAKTFRDEMFSRFPTTPLSRSTPIIISGNWKLVDNKFLNQSLGYGSATLMVNNNNEIYVAGTNFESSIIGSPELIIPTPTLLTKQPNTDTNWLVLDEVSPEVVLTRGKRGGLFNYAAETGFILPWAGEGDASSPEGTEWNSSYVDFVNYGWGDLTNVSTRTYGYFNDALDGAVGDNAVSTELVMRDVANNKYYKFDITAWGNGGGGTYSYTRQEIDTATGNLIGSPVTITRNYKI